MPFENSEYFECKVWRKDKNGNCLCQSATMMRGCLYFSPSFGTDFLCLALNKFDCLTCDYKTNEGK